jgi:hypothetical protein
MKKQKNKMYRNKVIGSYTTIVNDIKKVIDVKQMKFRTENREKTK